MDAQQERKRVAERRAIELGHHRIPDTMPGDLRTQSAETIVSDTRSIAPVSASDGASANPSEARPQQSVLDSVERLSRFVPLLVDAILFLQAGGSRQVFELNDEREALINALLPAKESLRAWIYSIGHSDADDDIFLNIERIRTDPSTIAYAVHGPDHARSCLHIHVLSHAGSHETLRQLVQGGGCKSVYSSAAEYLQYLDTNAAGRKSLSCIHFGAGALPELRVLVTLKHFRARVFCAGFTGQALGWEGAFDVAEFLHRRIEAKRRYTAFTEPVIPLAWGDVIEGDICDGQKLLQMGYPDCDRVLRDNLTRLSVGWNRLQAECRPSPQVPPAVHMGLRSYYDALLRAMFKYNRSAIAHREWLTCKSGLWPEHPGQMSTSELLSLAWNGLGHFEFNETGLKAVRDHYRNRPREPYTPRGAVGIKTDADARLLEWAETDPGYQSWLFYWGFTRFFSTPPLRQIDGPSSPWDGPVDYRTETFMPMKLANLTWELHQKRMAKQAVEADQRAAASNLPTVGRL